MKDQIAVLENAGLQIQGQNFVVKMPAWHLQYTTPTSPQFAEAELRQTKYTTGDSYDGATLE